MARNAQRADPRPFARGPLQLHGFLSVATTNLGDGPSSDKVHILNELRSLGFVIICCQEAGDREMVLRNWCARHGYVYFGGDGSPGSSSTPILYMRGLKIIGAGTKFGSPRRNAGSEGAGPDVVKRKVINWIKIRGGWVVTNSHLVASSTYAEKRRPLYAMYIDNLVEFLRDQQGYTISVGDFNAEDDYALLKGLRAYGRQVVRGDTHERRGVQTIDHMWINGKVVAVSIWKRNVRSDHHTIGGLFAKRPVLARNFPNMKLPKPR